MHNKRQILQILSMMLVVMLMLTLAGPVAAQKPDSDGDGLPDDSDECTHVAGPRENNGCPVTQDGDEGVWEQPDDPSDPAGDPGADDSAPSVALPELPSDGTCVVASNDPAGSNVRDQPLLDALVIGGLSASDMVPPLFTVMGEGGLWVGVDTGDVAGVVAAWTLRFSIGCEQHPPDPGLPVPDGLDFGLEEGDPVMVGLLLPAVQSAREAARRTSSGPVPNPDDWLAVLEPLMGEDVPVEDFTFNFEKIEFGPDHDPLIITLVPEGGGDPVGVLLTTDPVLWLFDAEGIAVEMVGDAVLFDGASTSPVVISPYPPDSPEGQGVSDQIEPLLASDPDPVMMLTLAGLHIDPKQSAAPPRGHDRWIPILSMEWVVDGDWGNDILLGGTGPDDAALGGAGLDHAACEAALQESGEKGGTEDINIGIGELQECNLSLYEIVSVPGDTAEAKAKLKITYCPPKKWSDYCLVVTIPLP